MAIAESILPEFDHETATTRTLLERVPADKAEWKPHAKSMSLGQLAMHIANLPHWASITLERTEFDTNPPDGPRVTTPAFESGGEAAADLRRERERRARAARADDRWRVHGAVDAEERREEPVQHAARRRVQVVRPEPRRASSRTVERVSPPARRPDPEYLRADSRYTELNAVLDRQRRRDARVSGFEKNSLRPLRLCGETHRSAKQAPDDERHVGRPLAEAPHEVRKPLPPERHVDAHPVTGVSKRVLKVAADAVEHLKFVGVLARSRARRRSASRRPESPRSCVAIAGYTPSVSSRFASRR